MLLLAALLLAGCALEDGRGFARLSGELWVHYAGVEPGAARLRSDGWFQTDNTFELRLTRLELEVELIELRAAVHDDPASSAPASSAPASSGPGGCSFDPQAPPDGCTGCHGGHCHCGDTLQSYAEIEARLCGGDASRDPLTTVAALLVGQPLSLLGPGTRSRLSACTPSCELPLARVTGVRAVLHGMRLHGTVRDPGPQDRFGGLEPTVAVELDLHDTALQATLATHETIDRHQPYAFGLAVALELPALLLDGIEWHALERTGDAIIIDAATNTSTGAVMAARIAGSGLCAAVSRAAAELSRACEPDDPHHHQEESHL